MERNGHTTNQTLGGTRKGVVSGSISTALARWWIGRLYEFVEMIANRGRIELVDTKNDNSFGFSVHAKVCWEQSNLLDGDYDDGRRWKTKLTSLLGER